MDFIKNFASQSTFESLESHPLFASAYQLAAIKRLERCATDDALRGLIANVLKPALLKAPVSSNCWQPELGAAMMAMQSGCYQKAAVYSLLALQALRVPSRWEIDIIDPMRVSIGGHLFDISGNTVIESDNSWLSVWSHAPASRLELHWVDGRWERAQAGSLPDVWRYAAPIFAVGGGVSDIYIQAWEEPNDGRQDIVAEWPLPYRADKDLERVTGAAAAIGGALDVLQYCGPHYIPWIRQLFRGVASTPLGYDDMRQSGSYLAHAGVFNCGFPGAPPSLAEVIVHEVSHQNFLLLNSLYQLCDDSVDGLLYSSLKRKQRPLSRVLFAYHAAANMAIFWSDLSKKRRLDDYYLREQQEMNDHAVDLYRTVKSAKGLTQHGALFFNALAQTMQEKGILAA